MKLKEIPLAIYTSIKLSSLSAKKLKRKKSVKIPVIVSLTSIPSRLKTLHLVVRSLLDQHVEPKKIVLWLHEDLKATIPKKLQVLEGRIFEIRFSRLTCSHRKLIHSLDVFPEDIIITCDDDLLYRNDWLNLLYQEHLLNPKVIFANQTRYIQYADNGELLPYRQWYFNKDVKFNQKAVIPIGAGGVLYPAKCLNSNVTNSELFLKLAPKADDLWFKAMALLNGIDSFKAKQRPKNPIPIFGTQKQSLKKTNIGDDKNRTQWLLVTQYFDIDIRT